MKIRIFLVCISASMLLLICSFKAGVAPVANSGVNTTFGEPANITPKLVENLQCLPGFTALPQPIPRYGATLLPKEILVFTDVSVY